MAIAKDRIEESREEGETKQGAEKMALFFIHPLSLISPFPLSFRNGEKQKRKNNEKEKGKEQKR